MASHFLITLALGVLLGADGRGSRGRRKWRGTPGGRSAAPVPAPAVVSYQYAIELEAESWHSMVEVPANLSAKPEYFPLVMFHVSWCKHCQATLPEFEHAAHMVQHAQKEGQLEGLSAPVKYFILRCDKGIEERKICDRHPGPGLPMLKLFRDKREIMFTGERWAKKIAEWSAHVSRPVVLKLESNKDLTQYTEDHGQVVFAMTDVESRDPVAFQNWVDLAYEHIEETIFCVVSAVSEVGQTLPPDQGVYVFGKDIEANRFSGSFQDKHSLSEWVKFNRWPVVVPITPEVGVKLLQSGKLIVAYAFKYARGGDLGNVDPQYRVKASEMRRSAKYIFGSIDLTSRENANFLSRVFGAVSVPSIFVFSGNSSLSKNDILYWEDPLISNSNFLSEERLEHLLADDWARQDNTTFSRGKTWGKWTYRFATGSFVGLLIMVLLPLGIGCLCCFCARELNKPDEPLERILKPRADRRYSHCSSCNKQWRAEAHPRGVPIGRPCPVCKKPVEAGLIPFASVSPDEASQESSGNGDTRKANAPDEGQKENELRNRGSNRGLPAGKDD